MGGKRVSQLKSLLKKFKAIRTWQLFLIFILMIFVSATLLRVDHIKMASLRDEVLAADAENDDSLLTEKLLELKSFVSSHAVLNVIEENGIQKLKFGTGPFYLEHTYLRDASAALEAASELEIDDSNPYGNVYALASAVCRPRAIQNGWAWNSPEHIACYQEELAKYPAESYSSDVIKVDIPSTELYRREFLSPVWAPTVSGFVVLVTLVLGVVIFIRFFIWLILEITLSLMKSF